MERRKPGSGRIAVDCNAELDVTISRLLTVLKAQGVTWLSTHGTSK